MPAGYVKINVNSTDWTPARESLVRVKNYCIQNYTSSVLYLSHDGQNIADEIDPTTTQLYREDYQSNFYFKLASGTGQVKLVWW